VYLKERGFLPQRPSYLRWTYYGEVLPVAFHAQNAKDLYKLLKQLTKGLAVIESISHVTVLVLGFIYREFVVLQFVEEDTELDLLVSDSVYTVEHWESLQAALVNIAKTTTASKFGPAPTGPQWTPLPLLGRSATPTSGQQDQLKDFPTDDVVEDKKLQLRYQKQPLVAFSEPRPPTSVNSASAARKFLLTLSNKEVYKAAMKCVNRMCITKKA
ncbi:hypothetical protein HWV62_17918, partial [Athelia sp. TMB]